MNSLKTIFSALVFTLLVSSVFAGGEMDTLSIEVKGNCGQCKKRIEVAAFGKGVKSAVWNKDSKLLTVVYKSDKTDAEAIKARVLKAGHDTDGKHADDETYSKLPGCCKYRDRSCTH